MFGITLPVLTLANDGAETTDTVAGKPCIRLGFTWELSSGTYQTNGIKQTFGLVDTGADITVIDEIFAPSFGRPPDSVGTMYTPGTETVVPIYRGTLVFYGGSVLCQETQFISRKLAAHLPYRIMLGRTFLAQTTFTFNRSHGIKEVQIY